MSIKMIVINIFKVILSIALVIVLSYYVGILYRMGVDIGSHLYLVIFDIL